MKICLIALLVLSCAAAACFPLPAAFPTLPPATPTLSAPSPTVTSVPGPTKWIDAFFTGQALLDVNGNGQVDPADTPVARATFIARDARGAEFGSSTGADGYATVSYPGGAVYPVKLRIKPPEGSNLVLVGPAEIEVKDASDGTARFLFAAIAPTTTPPR